MAAVTIFVDGLKGLKELAIAIHLTLSTRLTLLELSAVSVLSETFDNLNVKKYIILLSLKSFALLNTEPEYFFLYFIIIIINFIK